MRISDWSSDVCSSDLRLHEIAGHPGELDQPDGVALEQWPDDLEHVAAGAEVTAGAGDHHRLHFRLVRQRPEEVPQLGRSEEHTSELQSLMRISYAVFCLKKKKNNKRNNAHMRSIKYIKSVHK